MEKQCTKCCAVKDVSEFSWKKKSENKKCTICKECHRAYNSNWYSRSEEKRNNTKARSRERKRKRRIFILRVLRCSKCIDCGISNMIVLQFDHVGNKNFEISKAASKGLSVAKIKEEMRKCEIRCANCHAIRTAKEQGWYKDLK